MQGSAMRGSVQAGIFCGSSSRGIAGLEGLAQTDVLQDAADYNRR